MEAEHLVRGMSESSTGLIRKTLDEIKNGMGMLEAENRLLREIDSVQRLALQFLALNQPTNEETPEFEKYIRATASVPLPTQKQMKAFVIAIDTRDKFRDCKSEYFRGYHFFIDLAVGQNDYSIFPQPATKLGPMTREEHKTKFGYIEFEPIIQDNFLCRPEACSLDKQLDSADINLEKAFVKVPGEVLRLGRLVSLGSALDKTRTDSFYRQISEMTAIVRYGREKYSTK